MNLTRSLGVAQANFLAAYTAVNHGITRETHYCAFLAAYTAVNASRAVLHATHVFLAAYTAVN